MEDNFLKLLNLNVNDKTEKKKNLTYLSWSWAWAEFKKVYPDARYIVKKNEQGLPFFYDKVLGYLVYTEVTAGNLTYEMWLPVMDGANKTMKDETYTYTNKYGEEKTVETADMFDINKTIMRCLVKNLAMFGLGLYIYSGEDLPEEDKKEQEEQKKQQLEEQKRKQQEELEKKARKVTAEEAQEIVNKITEYAQLKGGDAGELIKHYITKNNVKDIKDLTYAQSTQIINGLVTLIAKLKK